MKDTPGWASPGSAASDGQEPGANRPAEPADRPGPAQPAEQPGAGSQDTDSKWSKEQPPPGDWSAPTGAPAPGQTPPPPPGPGWGGQQPGGYGGPGYPGPGPYGAWGGRWGGPPPAAKPGVIPLRPLGVGEILDGAVSTMRTYWRTVLGISLTVAVVSEVLVTLLQGFVLKDSASTETLNDPNASLSEVTHAMGDVMVSSGVVALISLIGTIVATALLTTVTSRAVLGKPVTTAEAWHDARPQIPRLFGLVLLLPLIALGVLLCGVLPGVLLAASGGDGIAGILIFLALIATLWLMVRFSLASPALMLEKQGILKSLGRSAKLVRGSWWRVFGIQLLAVIIAFIISLIIAIPFGAIAAAVSGNGVSNLLDAGNGDPGWAFLIVTGIGSVISSMITFPITAGVTVLLYIDQRIRREALDLELARAAGVQGYGGTPGTTPGS